VVSRVIPDLRGGARQEHCGPATLSHHR